jgi:hypothetical protein
MAGGPASSVVGRRLTSSPAAILESAAGAVQYQSRAL